MDGGFKVVLVGEMERRTFLSVAKEKYQKNRHVRKGPRSFPYGSYPLSGAALFALRQKGFTRCHFTDRRTSATSAERRARGTDLFAGMCGKFSLSSPRFRRFPRGRRSAVRAGYRVSPTFARNQTPSPLRWRRGRAATEGFLREASKPPLSGALLVLFSRQGEKSTHINLPDKPKSINSPCFLRRIS